MSAEIVSLNQYRKAKQKAEKEEQLKRKRKEIEETGIEEIEGTAE